MALSKIYASDGAKPFLKWAGGKGQIINEVERSLPPMFTEKKKITYVEPFVGSGAVMFWIARKYNNISKIIINDKNRNLINAYNTIKKEPEYLIKYLSKLQNKYFSLKGEEEKKEFFLNIRENFNEKELNSLEKTGLMIFINKTCYNGLYRVNSKGKFNVPFGRNRNPNICDKETIIADSHILQRATILNEDFADITKHIKTKNVFYYFDPPYKPLSKTASFNSYFSDCFNDMEQERLHQFCKLLHENGAFWLLSNSDLKNTNKDDNYFDELYKDFFIKRITAIRKINSKGAKRGEIFELLISNYK